MRARQSSVKKPGAPAGVDKALKRGNGNMPEASIWVIPP
jgi:hypothetical protein